MQIQLLPLQLPHLLHTPPHAAIVNHEHQVVDARRKRQQAQYQLVENVSPFLHGSPCPVLATKLLTESPVEVSLNRRRCTPLHLLNGIAPSASVDGCLLRLVLHQPIVWRCVATADNLTDNLIALSADTPKP